MDLRLELREFLFQGIVLILSDVGMRATGSTILRDIRRQFLADIST